MSPGRPGMGLDEPEAGVTSRLAQFACTPADTLANPQLRRLAARCFVDTVAVTIAGACEPGPRMLEHSLEPAGQAHGVIMPWTASRYREQDAALLLGMASHVLDYDDVSMLAVCHPSAPIVSALWALSSSQPLSGRELTDAYLAGTEIMIRSGQAMGFRHYRIGFHSTATLGALGAAAACACALGLGLVQTRHALAIASSLSSGMRKNFGTMVKSLHVGLAASEGLRAARLAQAGLQGAVEPLEHTGWLSAFSGGQVDVWPAGLSLGQPWAIERPGFEQKRYPCCYMTHKMIEAVLSLRRRHGLRPEGLVHAEVVMGPGGAAPLIHPMADNGLHAKFSAPYAVACALTDGHVGFDSFENASVLRPAVRQLMARVNVGEAPGAAVQGSDLGSAPVTVTLTYASGLRYSQTIEASPGSLQDPLSDADLLNKWRDCLVRGLPGLDAGVVRELFAQGMEMEALPHAGQWFEQLRRG